MVAWDQMHKRPRTQPKQSRTPKLFMCYDARMHESCVAAGPAALASQCCRLPACSKSQGALMP